MWPYSGTRQSRLPCAARRSPVIAGNLGSRHRRVRYWALAELRCGEPSIGITPTRQVAWFPGGDARCCIISLGRPTTTGELVFRRAHARTCTGLHHRPFRNREQIDPRRVVDLLAFQPGLLRLLPARYAANGRLRPGCRESRARPRRQPVPPPGPGLPPLAGRLATARERTGCRGQRARRHAQPAQTPAPALRPPARHPAGGRRHPGHQERRARRHLETGQMCLASGRSATRSLVLDDRMITLGRNCLGEGPGMAEASPLVISGLASLSSSEGLTAVRR